MIISLFIISYLIMGIALVGIEIKFGFRAKDPTEMDTQKYRTEFMVETGLYVLIWPFRVISITIQVILAVIGGVVEGVVAYEKTHHSKD